MDEENQILQGPLAPKDPLDPLKNLLRGFAVAFLLYLAAVALRDALYYQEVRDPLLKRFLEVVDLASDWLEKLGSSFAEYRYDP